VSVDTHLRGKNLEPYQRLRHGGVELLLNPRLVEWAAQMRVDAGRRAVRTRLLVDLEHRHGPHCRH